MRIKTPLLRNFAQSSLRFSTSPIRLIFDQICLYLLIRYKINLSTFLFYILCLSLTHSKKTIKQFLSSPTPRLEGN